MTHPTIHVKACLCVLLLFVLCPPAMAGESGSDIAFFEERIRPVLVQHCYECHSAQADELEGSLQLDSLEAMQTGGDTGSAIVPGNVQASLLLQAIRYQDLEMPPAGKLPPEIIRDFEQWVRSGAAVPGSFVKPKLREPDYSEDRTYWAFQRFQRPPLPAARDKEWPNTPIDYYVLERLEDRGLHPAPPATRRVLIRRVYFDLIGLPPTPEQVRAFVNDSSPKAYERVIDQLLASPRYGERWAQHWLDVVRYAESEGFEYDRKLPDAWRFRDYVIEAFNEDKPYDEFIAEQIAGDELNPDDLTCRVAAGFHRLGSVRRNAGNQKVASSRNEVLTERTDIVASAFLGLTVGCARCHDHKFDPISQLDYYRLQAFMAATAEDNVVLASAEVQKRWQEVTSRIEQEIAALKKVLQQQQGTEELPTREKLKQLEAQLPAPLPTLCSIKNDHEDFTPVHLLRRGDPDVLGPVLGMRPLGVLLGEDAEEWPADTAAPRTKLASWLTDPLNPLTARVMVNRVWQHHFGQGLVQTANDFGKNGDRPSHPELLDYLAHEFVASGWRIKWLHRLILRSSAYRQSSAAIHIEPGDAIDPENRFLWRFSRRRLGSEEIRDAMLSVAGVLNSKARGESVMLPVDQELIDQLYKPTQWQITADRSEHHRRSIYLIAKRNLRLPFMEVFDQPTAQTSCAIREQSTHAPQALELLNGPLSNELAEALAARLQGETGDEPSEQVDRAYELVAGRPPTPRERELSLAFIQEVSLREFALAMLNLNAFLYVD